MIPEWLCETLALASDLPEDCPFSTTLWKLFLRRLSKAFTRPRNISVVLRLYDKVIFIFIFKWFWGYFKSWILIKVWIDLVNIWEELILTWIRKTKTRLIWRKKLVFIKKLKNRVENNPFKNLAKHRTICFSHFL